MNFDLYLPVEVIFGVGSVNKVGEVGRRFGYRVLIATGKKSTKENGALDRVVESLNRNGAEEIIIFDQIEPNPTDKSVNLASEIVVKEKIDYIIGLGGGSSLDSAKAISIVSSNEGYAWDYVNYPEGPRLIPFLNRPVICIPTTAGTGSEVNRYSVLSNPIRKEKMVISHSLNYPRVAIIDPSLTVSMDRRLTALTGIDALMHALESLTNRLSNFFAEDLAIRAIQIIRRWLPVAIEEPENLQARSYMSYAAMLAGIAIDRKRVALIHGMEHPVSAHYPHIAHAEGLSALGVAITDFNYKGNPEKYALFAELMGYKPEPHMAVKALEDFLEKVGLRLSLKELGVEREKIERLTEDTYMLSRGLFPINPVEPTMEDIYKLYERAYEGY
ncbi:MAG: iron-containing alcohol dehydrogenase [Aquificota bacterium]|nr:iron-containing alcohol dehydrogenase [Aquificaceae bacterium]MDM7267036.1 iron-containing alcohol dehydrogenase [Aquificaceae bacterium]HCO39048.1 1,3-propanediol dehydrogenase [Aquificaceae bacterium]